MKFVVYSPELFPILQEAAVRMNNSNLLHRPFVDYYYTSSNWCRLYLFMGIENDIVGTIGVEKMTFMAEQREITVGFASNFYTLQPGAGGLLFLHWMKTCPLGVVFGGNEYTHNILTKQKWSYYPGAKTYWLNWRYETYADEPFVRVIAKWALRHTRRKRIARYASRILPEAVKDLAVREESSYASDLFPRRSPFTFRFAPTTEYLNWRYNTDLSFVRYRLFRILRNGVTIGYVVLNDAPEQVIVSHCDGEEAQSLAYGVLRSVLEVAREDRKPRAVLLSSSHPVMQRVYEQFGFRAARQERPLVFGAHRCRVQLPSDTSRWLINFDWGDNGLRSPFLDQPQ